jgi:1,4-dihydroxy-2-naphthoate octaprenyltransferase
MENKNSSVSTLIRMANPLLLLMGLFTYILGLGLLHYLGQRIDWSNAMLGSLIILAILISRSFLHAYFNYPEPIPSSGIIRTRADGSLDLIEVKELQRQLLMQISLVMLSLGAVVTTVLIFRSAINISVLLTLGLCLALLFLDVFPPFKLNKKGYSELIEAFLIANMAPALAFLLQKQETHVLLVMLTLPLTLLYLAMRIASSFEYYSYDSSHSTGSMLLFMGWQRGMMVHNLSILLAFLLAAAFLVVGLSWHLAWPIFLALPIGGMQIFQMMKIADGAKPNWGLFRLNALATVIIVMYLITFTLWIH